VRERIVRLGRAERAYREALRLEPDYAIASIRLGRVLQMIGKPVEALHPGRTMSLDTALQALLLAMFLGGFVSGISGFAFSAVAGAILLQVYPPVFAVPLMMACALVAQLYSLISLRNSMEWRKALPLIVGGIVGMPIGLYALRSVDAHTFRLGFGIFLAVYSAYMLFWPATFSAHKKDGGVTSYAIGFAGGEIPSVLMNLPLLKNYSIVGVFSGAWCEKFPEEQARAAETVMTWISQDRLRPWAE